MHNQKNI